MDILTMCVSASVMIVAIVIIRAFTLHKLPKRTFLVLWFAAICRLLVPFSVPSRLSLYTGIDMVKRILSEKATVLSSPLITADSVGTANISGESVEIGVRAATAASAAATAPSVSPIAIVWLIGMLACALFFIVAYIKCRREFKTSLPVESRVIDCWLRENTLRRTVQIRQSDRIQAPLTYGVFRPVILLPKTTNWTDETGLKIILTHEFTHIRRFDTLTKLVLTAVVCMHWFNPFVWVMYVLANRDTELACDEAVVRTLGETIKSAYAMTLIGLEEKKRNPAPLISGFSKNAIDERITAIMKLKKASFIVMILALALIIGTVTVFATNAAATVPQKIADEHLDLSELDIEQNVPMDSIPATGGNIVLSSVDFGTHVDAELIKGGVLLIGGELWEKGDEIVFRISADENMKLRAGVVPAENMDSDLASAIDKEIEVSSKMQEVSFTVPETGEYGIYVRHIKDERDSAAIPETYEVDASQVEAGHADTEIDISKVEAQNTVTFTLEINKVFDNPPVASYYADDTQKDGVTFSPPQNGATVNSESDVTEDS